MGTLENCCHPLSWTWCISIEDDIQYNEREPSGLRTSAWLPPLICFIFYFVKWQWCLFLVIVWSMMLRKREGRFTSWACFHHPGSSDCSSDWWMRSSTSLTFLMTDRRASSLWTVSLSTVQLLFANKPRLVLTHLMLKSSITVTSS